MRYGILHVILGMILLSGIAVAEPEDTEPNDTWADAQSIGVNGSWGGSLYWVDDLDWFSFSGEAGMEMKIELFHTGSFMGTTDFMLDFFGPPGVTWLAYSDTAPSYNVEYEKIDYTLTSTGTHYVLVSASLWASIAHSYSLKTTWVNQPTPTPTVTETPLPPTPTFTPWIPVTGLDEGVWEIYR
jgi:hypothetical protein